MKRSILTLFVIALFAVSNGQETISSTTGKVDFYGNDFSTNTINIGEFNPDRTCSSDASSAFISAFRSDKEVVFIPKGCYLIADEIIMPEGKTLVFEKGAILDVSAQFSGNYTKILAGQNQIFTLKSNISGTWQPHDGAAYVEWFGAKGDGTGTADMAAFQKTLEVFCAPDTIRVGAKDKSFYGTGVIVKATGSVYNVEQTLDFPPFGYLVVSDMTLMMGGTNNFFESFVNITETPYHIEGGRWIVQRYDAQAGWARSAKNSAAKYKYAYNKNPVFRLYLRERMHSTDKWGAVNSRYHSTISNLEIRMVIGYARYKTESYDLKYDAFFITSDTSEQTSGTLEWQRNYRIVDYHEGDDFTNVGATINATGISFLSETDPPGIHTPNAVVKPAIWTNGSVIRNRSNAAYFQQFHNVRIQSADTAIYMQGDEWGEMINSWVFESLEFDGCNLAIALGHRAAGHIFSNLVIQSPTADFQRTPQVDVRSSLNIINGVAWDIRADDFCTIYKGATGNTIDFIVEHNRFFEDHVKDHNIQAMNNTGQHNMWWRSENLDETRGSYWYRGRRMGIKDPKNKTVDLDKNPRALLDIVGKSGYKTDPVLILETQSSAYSPNNKIDNLTGFGNALSINQRVAPNQTTVRPGFGSSIRFFVTNENEPNKIYNQYPLGIIGFRQNNSQFLKTHGEQSAFQIWQSSDGTWLNTMTINPQGKMGLLGVYNPKYTLDLSAAGTLRSGNILDDGNDVEIKSPLSINILHFTPTKRPAKATLGDMYLSSEDGNLYFYTNSGWKTVVLE